MLNQFRKKSFIAKYLFKLLLPIYRALVRGNSVTGNNAVSAKLTGDSYYIVNVNNKSFKKVASLINKDGHPSVIPNNNDLLLTDCYPDESSVASLYIYDLSNDKLLVDLDVKSNEKLDRTPMRCDLHPKVSFDGNYVFIDTVNETGRKISGYTVNVD